MKRVLLVWPIHTPYYWNLCYHFTHLGETAGYLSQQQDVQLTVIDAGVQNYTWGELLQSLHGPFDVIVVVNTIDNIVGASRLINIARVLCPAARLLTLGHVSSIVPGFFKQFDLDGIVYSGDWELVLRRYLDSMDANDVSKITGMLILFGHDWVDTGTGELCDPALWGYPALDRLPLSDFARVVQERELAVTASRGCPVGCYWCKVPYLGGTHDRRRPVSGLLDFIEANHARFDFVSLFSPTFTADPTWVQQFCHAIARRHMSFPWKCTTTIFHALPELLPLMAQAGCYRIGFGVETLERAPQAHLKKSMSEERIEKSIKACLEVGIEALCFLMIGVPGQTREGVYRTLERIQSWGGLPRVTAYAPVSELRDNMSDWQIEAANQKMAWQADVEGMDRHEILELLFSHKDRYASTLDPAHVIS